MNTPDDVSLAQQFNGCTSNCGSICDYIVDLTDDEFERTINSLGHIGAQSSASSLEASRENRLRSQAALTNHRGNGDNFSYFEIKKHIDSLSYELEDWPGWYESR